MRDRRSLLTAGLLASLFVVGCAPTPPPVVPVSGKLVFTDGRPLAQATIQLIPEPGTGASAQSTTGDDGTFEVETCVQGREIHDGAIPGKYKVVVIPYPHGAKIDAKYGSLVSTPLQVEVPATGVTNLKLVVQRARK